MAQDQVEQAMPIYTIGYGSRTLEEFLIVLLRYGINFLIDVRSQPYSRFKPEFGKEALHRALLHIGVRYAFMGDTLGGRPPDPTCYTEGKVDYEKYREKPFFREGLTRLWGASEEGVRVAVMCSEGKPEECHRSKLIGVSLAGAGMGVLHIDEVGKVKTQQEVIGLLTGGQLSLFGDVPLVSTSRKKYRPRQGHDGHGEQA